MSLLFLILAFTCALINSSLGMLYGTLLTPTLIILGIPPLTAIPAVLLSQSLGSLVSASIHHRRKNVDFRARVATPKRVLEKLAELGYIETIRRGTSRDLRVSLLFSTLGILAVILAVLLAVNIPKIVVQTYIALLVTVMGFILIFRKSFIFSWKRIAGISILSAFNKGFAGGGFGPVTTAGQILSGRNAKNAIGSTLAAEIAVTLVGFITYTVTKGVPTGAILVPLILGAVAGSLIGPGFTSGFASEDKLKILLGIILIALGVWTLFTTWSV